VRRHLLTLLLAAGVAVAVVACGSGAKPSFDPTAPCTADVKQPGAYPTLEALIPSQFDGRKPDRLDSGRNCTSQSLGTLAAAGIRELRFAGGLWEVGQRSGVTLAVLSAPGLTADAVADFYESGAEAAKKTENVKRSPVSVGDAMAWQVETLNDESYQSIVVWQGTPAATVKVVLVGSDVRETNGMAEHRDRVARAEQAFTGS
jgi:hypothetical protein